MQVIVTRHKALVQLLLELGLVSAGTPVLSHANADDVRNKDVFGVLPNHLSALATSITEIPLALDPEDRGRELSIERLREVAGEPVRYVVREIEGHFAVRFALHGMGGEYFEASFAHHGRGRYLTQWEAGCAAANLLMANPSLETAQVFCAYGDREIPVANYTRTEVSGSTSVRRSVPRFRKHEDLDLIDAVEAANRQ